MKEKSSVDPIRSAAAKKANGTIRQRKAARKVHGLLIEYDFCTGCFSCEVACQQEHDHPVGRCGIKVAEFVMETGKVDHPVTIDYVPVPTDLCDLCAVRVAAGELPTCVKHCQAACMHYGPVEELLKIMQKKPKTVLFRGR